MRKGDAESAAAKGYKGLAMEGAIARWYAKNTRQDEGYKILARRLAQSTPTGSTVLEIAPGPGYLAIEFAKLGYFKITGLDISRTFVEIAQANAKEAGVQIDFRLGDAAKMPFSGDSFAFIFCRAAFKNFTDPVRVLNEIHRVLKPGGKAVIIDLRRDAEKTAIDECVENMRLSRLNRFLTRWTFRGMLVKSAYSIAEMEGFVAGTGFVNWRIPGDPMGFDLWLEK